MSEKKHLLTGNLLLTATFDADKINKKIKLNRPKQLLGAGSALTVEHPRDS